MTGTSQVSTVKNHNNFSGDLTVEDFSTFSPNKKRINTQMVADKLPEKLKNKKIKIEEKKKMQSYTLKELRAMKLVSSTNGRPESTLTDEKWQREFEIRKFLIKPTKEKRMGGKYSKESGQWNEESLGGYCGATNWQDYCSYINDVLSEIRADQIEYVYFIYQIMDLLRFHPNTLRTKYVPDGGCGYWKVWLER